MSWRYRFVFSVLVLMFLAILSRLFYWQIVRAEDLHVLAQSQYGKILQVIPKRGEIKTLDGFPIAANKVSYLVFANPQEIEDKEKVASVMSKVLETEEASISSRLELDRLWVPLKHDVDFETKKEIESLRIDGIAHEEKYTRFYPEASMAAHLLGIVGKDKKGQDKGYFGLEGYYDRLLRGKEGILSTIQDALGKPILSTNQNDPHVEGSSLILGIERAVQFMVEKKLKEGVEMYGADSGMIGILDPKTGQIIAMASYPSFNPGEYSILSEELFVNPFVSGSFEPGSTLKPIVMAAAFDLGVVEPESKCPICDGPIDMGEYEIRTWNDEYRKDSNMVDVIVHSDNTGMAYVAQKLGADKMISSLTKFGIGSLTYIDSQGEIAPSFKPRSSWYPVDLATAAFGQGISVTPIQLLTAFSAIANEGKMMQPKVVASVESPDGEISRVQSRVLGEPISASTAKVMTEVLVTAVEKGEAQWTKLKGYRIAGKTGTASIPVKGHYDPNKTITSFIGFAPADDPRFAMLVVLNKPTLGTFGAESAAPIFFSLARDILSYYGIPPRE